MRSFPTSRPIALFLGCVLALTIAWAAFAPALATTARWVQIGLPPSVDEHWVYDSQRNRTLVFSANAVWAASDDSIPVWTHEWTGFLPWYPSTGYVYDPSRDRVWMFTFSNPVVLWYADLGVTPWLWTQVPYTGYPPSGLTYFTWIFDPIRDRILTFGGSAGINFGVNWVYSLTLSGTPNWSMLSTSGPPSGRYGSVAVYDPWRDRMLVYGGNISGPIYYDETWALSLSGTPTWTFLPPTYYVALARTQPLAALDTVHRQWIVTGGRGFAGLYDDAWALDLSPSAPADSAAWQPINPLTTAPVRQGAVGWFDPLRERLVRYGGSPTGQSSDGHADTWALELGGSPDWLELTPDVVDPPAPARFGHVAFVDPDSSNFFVASGDPSNAWTRPIKGSAGWRSLPEGDPGPRYYSTAVVDAAGRQALLFGGGSQSEPTYAETEFNSLWSFVFDGQQWDSLPAPSPPTPRADAMGLFDSARRRLIVHGGRYTTLQSHQRGRTDTWSYDVAGNTWTMLAAGSFGERWSEVGIYDSLRDRYIVFGGQDSINGHSDVHVLPGSGGTWAELATSGVPPSVSAEPRALAAAYDPIGDRMVVVARSSSYLGFWSLFLSGTPTWSQGSLDGAPPQRLDYAATFDAASGGRLVLSGGRLGAYIPALDDTWALYLDETAIEPVSAPRPPAASTALVLARPRPNPTSGALTVSFTLPSGAPARLELLDIAGRRVLAREVGDLGPGTHTLSLEKPGAALAPGVYFLKLAQSHASRTARVVVLH